jgi:tetratricopeptide (TPR) repeat protein
MPDEIDKPGEYSEPVSDVPASGARPALREGMTLAGRFDVAEKLGAGGMGHVFAAFDRVRETRVAIKVLGKRTPRAIGELKREFRAASELVHPNLVGLHQLFCDDGEWMFSMDLVEGVDLAVLRRRERGLPEPLLRHLFRQLATALSVLHQAGTLHGDLKPSNFLIVADGHQVKLLDFGLSRAIGSEERRPGGTPGYMAPEQSVGDTLTEAADWYSFGVVLYEALTGTLPYRVRLETQLAAAPADLRDLCLRLLRFAATDRAPGAEVIRVLGATRPTDTPAVGPRSRRGLVNRHVELGALQSVMREARAGRSAIVLMHGPSGIGKTALVERFVEEACAAGARLLASRCRERESMGYKAVDGLVDDIVRVFDGLDASAAADLVPDGIEDLTLLFPALNAADAVERAPKKLVETLDQTLVRQRAIAVFHELFKRLAAREPVIVWMDDLQWSDPESALLLAPLLRVSEPLPLLFIGTYRTMQHGRGPLLDALLGDKAAYPAPVELLLEPLSPADSERLALESIPADEPDAPGRARTIARDAGGHPLFIAELAHATRGLSASPADAGPSTLLDLVRARIASLPPDARELLELTAVAGVPLSRGVLRRARRLDPASTERALDLLRACRLARSHGPDEDDVIDMHHDRIREIVAEHVDDRSRRAYHVALARVLEADPETKPDVLAAHYQASGDARRAGRFWLAAADLAMRALAFEHAADLFTKGLATAELGPDERRALQIRQAEALAHAGRGPAAAATYLAAAASCPRDQALELRRLAAEQLLLCGHLDHGLRVIDEVLRSLGLEAGYDGRSLLAVLKGRVLVRLRGLRHLPRTESQLAPEDLARLDASWTLACSLSLIDPMRGAAFQSTHMLLALKAGEPRRLLRALTLEVSYAATPGIGSERRATQVLDVANALVRNQSDYAALALLSLARGVSAHLQGQLESALTHCEEALSLLGERCVGAVWETMSAQRFAIAALFFLGRLRRLGEFAAPLLTAAEGTGNLYATLCFRTGYSTVAWLARDRVDEARRQLDRAREELKETGGAPLLECNVVIGATFLDLYTGDAERALARVRASWPMLRASRLLDISVLRVQVTHLLAGALAQAATNTDDRESGPRRREVRQWARRMRTSPIQRARPLADLLEAGIDRHEGDIHAAERRLRRSIAAFDSLGMRLFAAAARARLGELTPGEAGEDLTRRGYAEVRSEGVVDPHRIVGILAPGFGPSPAGR